MKIILGSDHAGFELKAAIITYLNQKQIPFEDLGAHDLTSVDYPDYAKAVAKKVANQPENFGILFCGTGIGMSIAANKVKGIRAALVYDVETASLAKKHNNANVIAIGGRKATASDAIQMVETYLTEVFEERHLKRIHKIDNLEGDLNE